MLWQKQFSDPFARSIRIATKNIGDDAFAGISVVYHGTAEGTPWGASILNGIKQEFHQRDSEIEDDDE